MKKLRPTIKSLKDAELIFQDESRTKIFYIGDNQYAIQVDWKKMPICAFKSEAFGLLLKKHQKEISNVSITKYKCEMCACKGELIDVHLQLDDERITIEHNGTLTKTKEYEI